MTGAATVAQRRYRVLGILLFCGLSFGLGMAAVKMDFYAFQKVKEAGTAIVAINRAVASKARDEQQMPVVTTPGAAARRFEDVGNDELILVAGGPHFLTDVYPGGCTAWLMDREGKLRHYWKYDRTLWEDQNVATLPGISSWQTIGVQLFPNGDLLANFQCRECWPYAGGIARFDKDSKLIWKTDCLSHHWFSVAGDGRIFVPALNVVESPMAIGDTKGSVSSLEPMHRDFILVLDQNGKKLEEIPMLDVLADSGWPGLVWNWKPDSIETEVDTTDPLHFNEIQLVNQDVADRFPWLNVGDLVLSFRNLNAIGILDIKTRKMKWMASGCFVRQHSPRFYQDGILVFDNLGGDAAWGGTQLLKVDFERRLPQRIFPVPGVPLPGPCECEKTGHLDLHPDGRRALVMLGYQGRIWEVDLETGKVLWEYVHTGTAADGKALGRTKQIFTAKYVYQTDFPLNVPEPE